MSEDSLNERTEDRNKSEMDALRMRLNRPKSDEPSKEQLRATEELDEEGDEGEEEGEEPIPGPAATTLTTSSTSKEVALPKETNIRKQIEELLLQGLSREEIAAKGFNKGSIRTVASELKSKMNSSRAIGKAPLTTTKGLPVFAHGSPPEAIIDAVEIPDVADGQGVPFEQGIKFGMSILVLGVRMVQELAGIGVLQAKPILEMSKSMREGEALAAKNSASQAADEAAGQVMEALSPVLANLQNNAKAPPSANPMQDMMVRLMEPNMKRLMGGMFSMLTPGQQQNQIPEQASPDEGNVEGWKRRSE
jgi:hypothetical protein